MKLAKSAAGKPSEPLPDPEEGNTLPYDEVLHTSLPSSLSPVTSLRYVAAACECASMLAVAQLIMLACFWEVGKLSEGGIKQPA